MIEIGLADKNDDPPPDVADCFPADTRMLTTERMKQDMRSEDVFAAAKKINNRFLLCRVTSVSAHRIQGGPRQFTESINKSLKLIAAMSSPLEKGGATGESRINVDHLFLSSLRNINSKPVGQEPTFEPFLETLPVG